MQQIFMSFVPAVFKKNLSQYFTPIGLIQTIVQMVKIGPNDKVADPGMGTADFLSAAMEYRANLGDRDIDKRVFGIDCDKNAFDLANVNMILNKDGQSGLFHEDSIENYQHFKEDMQIVLCNQPFGQNSLEKRPEVLKEYDLGHRWEYTSILKSWIKTEDILPSQQLGILFIERCYKMLSDRERLGIILPEGYLCTTIYGYVRTWMLEHLRILSLTELPRRMFMKSDVDLRSNILIAQKLPSKALDELVKSDYPIHADMVRKVGFKLGKGYQPLYVRDPDSGIEIRDTENNLIQDTDFRRVCEGFEQFTSEARWDRPTGRVVGPSWKGARIRDIRNHLNLDMKQGLRRSGEIG
jgi:type I restriction enzyme M protein